MLNDKIEKNRLLSMLTEGLLGILRNEMLQVANKNDRKNWVPMKAV